MRRLVCIFLLLLVPLHSFAMQCGSPFQEHVFDLAHEAAHLEGQSHHHQDDGTLQFDDSVKSAQHHAEHSASCHAIALPPSYSAHIALNAYPVVTGEWLQYIPDRAPDQPHRPPAALG